MKKINIPIHKHTPKRYSRSRWLVLITQDGYQMGVRDEQECIFNCPEEHEPLLEWLDKEIQKARVNELERLDELEIFPYDCLELEAYVDDRIKQLEKE